MSTIYIEKLTIAGFRAYLREQSFKLHRKKTPLSLAVFAPNAKGKSSLVDAIEFYFSSDGTLARLGQKQLGTKAGPDALAHVDAQKKKINPRVTMAFRDGNDKFSDARDLGKAAGAQLPGSAQRIKEQCNSTFVIRGNELRGFVEERTSQTRYEDVSRWLMLSPLLEIQKNLRDLRLKLASRINDDPTLAERLRDLKQITNSKYATFDETTLVTWVNEIYIEPLDKSLALKSFDKESPEYKTIKARKEAEDKKIGLTAITAALNAITILYEKDAEQEDETKKDVGVIIALEEAATTLVEATTKEAEEKVAAQKAVFKSVWESTKTLLSDNDELADCPVCDTPFTDTKHGSRSSVIKKIKAELGELKSYSEADTALTAARNSVTQLHASLRTKLSTADTILDAAGLDAKCALIKEMAVYRNALGNEFDCPLTDSKHLKSLLRDEVASLGKEKKQLEEAQSDNNFAGALEIIGKLIVLKEKLLFLSQKKQELEDIESSLKNTERFIAKELRNHLQTLLDQLQDRMKAIYETIQPDPTNVPAIRLELDETSKQPQLHLLADFAPNKKGVIPSGYLSDSQLHTLALSLRIAAIEKANEGVPIMVFDDIVTSYDSDHRKSIASFLSSELADQQIIIVTHDELFYRYLEEHLPKSSWQFRRINSIEPDFGPRFHDHMVTGDMIKSMWTKGDFAANEIRQAEEEWLLKKAREFGVDIRIRDVHGAHKYDRGELAMALIKSLKEMNVQPPQVKGISNPFLTSLQKGNMENFGSHFSDDPNAWPSIGDEKKRWQEFEEFCGYFVCKCGSRKFKRPKVGFKRAACQKCETPFEFPALKETNE